MKIVLVSVDHTSAGIELREQFSFTESTVREAVRKIHEDYPVEGVVLLSTCNRTELYLSGEETEALSPVSILREIAANRQPASVQTALPSQRPTSGHLPTTEQQPVTGQHTPSIALLSSSKQPVPARRTAPVCPEPPHEAFRVLTGESAALHLMEVACGLRSRILCEDQIITQVKQAAAIAREEHTVDPVLSTLFRLASTAAKKAKTTVTVKAVPASAAESAVRLLDGQLNGLRDKRGLVIGNGEMGRLCAARLSEAGCKTTVTLRTYRHGETLVPRGCATVPYEERERLLPEADFVVSATASPHYTLTAEMLKKLPKRPKILIDLAVPRDIDPETEKLPGIACYNIDRLDCGPVSGEAPELNAVREIIAEQLDQFREWLRIRQCGNGIQNIKRIACKKVSGGLLGEEGTEEDRRRIELTVHKTVDLLMYSIKEELTPALVERIEKHILTSKNGGKPVE